MKIAVLSSHTTSLLWFRLDMMKAFSALGHHVVAVGSEPENLWKNKFLEFNIEYFQIPVDRNGINPLNDLRTLFFLVRFFAKEKPDKVFSYQAKTIVYGNLAAKINNVSEVYTLVAGLGSIFRGSNSNKFVIKLILKFQFWIACSFSKKVFFQNQDDRNEFIKYRLVSSGKSVIINGSGVDLEKFQPLNFPLIPSFLFIGRLLRDKGIIEYLEASRIVKKKYGHVRFLLVGPFDTNPSSLKESDLESYISDGTIEYFGEQNDVRRYLLECSVFVLPSYHEGTPKTVLEAMASRRPIITTDAPGCKDTVINGTNGFKVPIRDSGAIAEKMEWFLINPSFISKMGNESLIIARTKYDVKFINKIIINEMKL